jgi:molecular chaperone GrpE
MLSDHEDEIKKAEQTNEKGIEIDDNNTEQTPQNDDVVNDAKVKKDEATELKELLAKKEEEAKELLDHMQRLAAEFDNFRKRTQKEKDRLYVDAVSDVVSKFLQVYDSLERALQTSGNEDSQGLKEGVNLVFKQISDILSKLDVKPIDAVGTTFNPEFHNAVMHVEDEALGHNIVIEEFQKGFIYKDDIVIRHSMVKVAN